MERFFSLLKSELLYPQAFESLQHFQHELSDCLDYQNNHRGKVKLEGLPSAIHKRQSLSAV